MKALYKKYGEMGFVMSGDFNDTNQSTMYKSILSFMDDSIDLATTKLAVGSTGNGYSPEEWENRYAGTARPTLTHDSPIDYIFLGKNTASVSFYTVLNDLFTFECDGKLWTDHPISDHYGVYCEATFTSPTSTITYDESKILSYRTTIQTQTPAFSLENTSIINDCFQISSNLKQTTPIQNLLINDSSVAAVRVPGNSHGIWEIELSADTLTKIKGFSFTTSSSSSKLPHTLRIYVSHDQKTWSRVGEVYTTNLLPSITYYITPNLLIHAAYIKIIFSDCNQSTELVNLTIYGN